MISQFFSILKVIGKENRIKSFLLLLILLFIIFLELLNFSLIIPILSIVFNNSAREYEFLSLIKNYLDLDIDNILIIGIIFISILCLKILTLLIFEYTNQKFSREINVDVTLKAYSYFLHSSWQEIFMKDHAYMMRNILSDSSTFVIQGIMKFIELFKNTILLIFILGFLFFVNLKATLVVLVIMTLFIFIFLIFFKKRFLKLSEMTMYLEKFRYKNISESIINLRDIKLTGSANYFLELFRNNEKKISKVIINASIIEKLPRYLLELILVIFVFIALFFFNLKDLNMVELIPILGLYSFAALRMIPIFVVYNQSLQSIKMSKFQIDEVIKNARRYSELFIEKQNINYSNQNFKIDFKKDLEINIKNLNFSYDENNQIFENLSIRLKQNNTIFLEGSNGSGKSTFVDLISGMLKPSMGSIETNGINLNKISEIWKKNIGYVSQTNFLINDTIKNNIIFGRKDITLDKLEKVIDIVGLSELIKSLPEGLDTNVGNLGNLFSGGQKQKISIARALISNPKVIILDEATNALDIQGEKKFLEIINKIKHNKLIIFIAHSKTIKNFCDLNYLIKNKKIELIKNN